jgi:ATP phosphoribosyltransferase regulatory subunit
MNTYSNLPGGVEELLYPQSREFELLRRKILDVFHSWGFEYIEPPIIEYLDALLVGNGKDLQLQTLQIVDQLSGKQIGVRADITSQAVRIDAHTTKDARVRRLCYAGHVVYANPIADSGSRIQHKAGVEIFGSTSREADKEVISLMLETLTLAGIDKPVLLLGHVGVFHELVSALPRYSEMSADKKRKLFQAIQRKSKTDIKTLVGTDGAVEEMLVNLPSLMGDASVISEARKALAKGPDRIQEFLDEIEDLASTIAKKNSIDLKIDVAELSGFGYHMGPVFAVYHPRHGKALARGGRYDGVGSQFGVERPATGFDLDLKQILVERKTPIDLIFAQFAYDPAEISKRDLLIKKARLDGKRVQVALSPQENIPDECGAQICCIDGDWKVV